MIVDLENAWVEVPAAKFEVVRRVAFGPRTSTHGYGPPSQAENSELVHLVIQAQRGGGKAQAELVRRYIRRLTGFVYSMIGDADSKNDMVQVVLLKMLLRINALRDPALFEAWLFKLARNTVLDQMRRTRCRPVTVADGSALGELLDPTACDRSEEIMEAVEVATREWDERSRSILAQVIAGSDYRAIAVRENLTVGGVKLRLFRMRKLLRAQVPAALGESRFAFRSVRQA